MGEIPGALVTGSLVSPGGQKKVDVTVLQLPIPSELVPGGAPAEAEGSRGHGRLGTEGPRLRPCPHQVSLPLQRAGRGAGLSLLPWESRPPP